MIEGYVKDRQTQEAIPYCYVVLETTGMGTVTNLDGRFVLKIPDSLSNKSINIAHLGYGSRKLSLDIFQHLPDFLAPDRDHHYYYTRVGMERIDSGMVHVIAFEQKQGIKDPFFLGKLYIDADGWALVRAEFEVNPRYVCQAGPNFIVKKSKNMDIEAQKISYSISYQQWNGYYWISHVRGDLRFKIKKKKSLFWSSHTLNTLF